MAAFTALALAGIAMSAYGQYKAGQAQKSAGEAAADISESQAKVADFNAHVAEVQATDAVERGDEAENRFRNQVKGVISTQRAGFAAGNIDVGFGSAVDVQADAARLGEHDALTIRTNAAREAWGYQVQAFDLHQQAAIDRKAAKNQILAGDNAATAGKFNAATAAITGTTSLLQAKYGFGTGRTD